MLESNDQNPGKYSGWPLRYRMLMKVDIANGTGCHYVLLSFAGHQMNTPFRYVISSTTMAD